MRLRSRDAWIATWSITLAACSSGERIFVAPPDLGDARGLVAIVHEPGGPRALGVDLTSDEPWRIEATYAPDDDVDVDLLAYDCTLDAWLVSPEDLGLTKSDGRSIPAPSRVLSASSSDGFEWRPSAEVPERVQLLEFEYTTPARCSEMVSEAIVSFGTQKEGRMLIPLDEDRMLVGLGSDGMFEVHRDGTATPFFPGATTANGDQYFNGFVTSDGTVYLVSRGRSCLGRVDTATITEIACLPLASGTDDGSWYHIDGEQTPDGLEVVAMSDNGETFVMPAGTMAFENITPAQADDGGRKADVVWVGPGEGLFAGPLAVDVQRYADGRSTIEPAELSSVDRVNGVGVSETHGSLVVTNLGDIQQRQPTGGWRNFGATAIPQGRFVIDIGGRILAAGSGLVVEIGSDGEACEAGVVLPNEINRLAKIGPDRFVALMRPKDLLPELHFFRLSGERAPTCE